MIPTKDLAEARAATARLLRHLDAVPGEQLCVASRLPGWSRAHVVAHLAGNALSHVRMLDGCLAGDVRTQYEGGREAREAAIAELGADPTGAVAEHRRACAELDQRWTLMGPEHWTRRVLRLDGRPEPATGLAWSRRREVEVHRVDLGTEYGPGDWPQDFARRLREELVERTGMRPVVEERVRGSDAAVAAWLSGRSDGADLTVFGHDPLPVPPPWT